MTKCTMTIDDDLALKARVKSVMIYGNNRSMSTYMEELIRRDLEEDVNASSS